MKFGVDLNKIKNFAKIENFPETIVQENSQNRKYENVQKKNMNFTTN
jgi:hypothetical protein